MKNFWIAIAVASAILCGFLGYKIASRKPVYVTVPGGVRPKAADVGDVIDEALKVDPKLIIAKETGRYQTGFKEARGVAVGPEDKIYAAGDKAVVVLSSDGKPLSRIECEKPATCVGVGPDSTVYVSFMDHIEVFDAKGARTAVWEKPGPGAWITSIAPTENEVYAADFGDKTVIRYDKAGKVLGRLGEPGPQAGVGKYEIPSPYFDVAIDPSGHPWVAHTGKLRIENYKDDGTMSTSWGKSSNRIEGFSGCCNPSHMTIRKDGSFVTSEKGLVRVKVHAANGDLVGLVAAAKDFEKGIHGLDLAVDSKDRILVLDPGTATVRVYALKGSESNP
jgi:hypothetical protein